MTNIFVQECFADVLVRLLQATIQTSLVGEVMTKQVTMYYNPQP